VATDYTNLIPANVAKEVIEAATQKSLVLQLGRKVNLPAGTTSFPVNSARPTAKFVTAHGGRKPISKIEWSAEKVTPEEIAVLVAIPDDFIADATFPIWAEVKPLLAEAIGLTLDKAVLFGTDAPATYPTGGVVAGLTAAKPPAGGDLLDAINAGMGSVEASGLMPNGAAANITVASLLRGLRDKNGAFITQGPKEAGALGSVWGMPLGYTIDWTSTAGDLLVGDWSKLVVGVRQDISFALSTEATIFDDAGEVVHSAFQDDVTIMRAYIRIGVALGKPVNAKGVVSSPFALVNTTPATS